MYLLLVKVTFHVKTISAVKEDSYKAKKNLQLVLVETNNPSTEIFFGYFIVKFGACHFSSLNLAFCFLSHFIILARKKHFLNYPFLLNN